MPLKRATFFAFISHKQFLTVVRQKNWIKTKQDTYSCFFNQWAGLRPKWDLVSKPYCTKVRTICSKAQTFFIVKYGDISHKRLNEVVDDRSNYFSIIFPFRREWDQMSQWRNFLKNIICHNVLKTRLYNLLYFTLYLKWRITFRRTIYTFSLRESDKSDTFTLALFSSSNIDRKLPFLYYLVVSKVKMKIKNQ
jgi:hypothetical protein